jgi:hypothetical protein
MKIMELVLQGNTPTGLFINKYNLVNNTLSEVTNAALNVIEQAGYSSGAPTAPVANSMLDRYLELAPQGFEFTQFYCRDIYNVNDFAQVNVAGAGWQGARAGITEPAFLTAKIKSTRTRQDIKAGFKALPYMLDADLQNAAGVLNAPYLALMTALTTTMTNGLSPFVGIATAFFGWAIVGKEQYVTPSGKTAYKYYDTVVEQAEHLAWPVTWTTVERATTQNTRKFGRGR